jgi:hypothetical protein
MKAVEKMFIHGVSLVWEFSPHLEARAFFILLLPQREDFGPPSSMTPRERGFSISSIAVEGRTLCLR